MKKMSKILIVLAFAIMVVCLMTACNENTKQDAIPTDKTYTTVSSNGGMAVQYGNYLYFVNGYVGNDVVNTFGSVKTGAICRVDIKLGENGIYFDNDSFKVIVPKNVYGGDTSYPGIYIANDYIYYHTTSVEKDGSGEYKKDNGVLMRTKVDGTDTKVVKEFDSNDTTFYVTGNYLVYENDNYLYGIRLSDLEEVAIETENTVNEYSFKDGYLIYAMYNYDNKTDASSDYIMKVFDFNSGKTTVVLSSEIINAGDKTRTALYVLAIKDVVVTADRLCFLYTKSDNQEGKYNGYYYATIDKNDIKALATEYRLSNETDTTSYSKLFVLQNGYVLTYDSGTFTIFTMANGVASRLQKDSYDPATESPYVTISGIENVFAVKENATEVYAYYTGSEVTLDDESTANSYKCAKLFNKAEGGYALSYDNITTFFYGVHDSTYTTYEVVEITYYGVANKTAEAILYLNDSVDDIAFYAIFDRNVSSEKKLTGKVLGKIDGEKLVDIISSGEVEEETEE